jgi:hypothetical protein
LHFSHIFLTDGRTFIAPSQGIPGHAKDGPRRGT